MSKKLRYYQIEAKEAVERELKKSIVNQLLVMATGSGKTATSVNIVNGKGRLLWGTHTEELLEQSAIALLAEKELMPYDILISTIHLHGGLINLLRKKQALTSLFDSDHFGSLIGDTIGIIKADLFIINKPIVLASMQTLHRRLDRVSSTHFDTIVVDECHYSGSKSWVTALNHFKPKLRLGLTATPFRNDGMLMGDIFDKIVYDYPIEKAIKDGFLCEIDAIRIKTEANIDNVKTLGGELNQGQLEEVVNTNQRNNLIVDKYIEYCNGMQFIAFCVDVQHAMDLTQVFKNRGVNVDFVVGDHELTIDRKGTIAKFKEKKLTGIINVMILTAGFDHPNTGAILMCCPTKSLTKFLQQIGRGTRLKDEEFVAKFGQKVKVLDFIDSTSKHRLINTWELDRKKEHEDKIFITKEKKDLLITARNERTFKAAATKQDQKIDLLKLPKVKISDSIRMQEPATEKQLEFIKYLDYDIENINYTKAMCSEIISNLPAKEWQIMKLKNAGYDVSKGVTYSEFVMAEKEIQLKQAKANTKALKEKNKFPYTDI